MGEVTSPTIYACLGTKYVRPRDFSSAQLVAAYNYIIRAVDRIKAREDAGEDFPFLMSEREGNIALF